MESYKLKVLEAESIKNLVLCFCHNAQDSRGDISFKFHRNIVYVQAVQNCKRCFKVVALNLCGNRDPATAGHHFSAKSI